MEKIKICISGNQIAVEEWPAVITSGTVGLTAEFTFDSRWEGLQKTAVFRAGEKTVAVPMETDAMTVPWEVLGKPKLWLHIGIYGVNGNGTVAIPTLWAQVAVIHTGADPEGDPAMDPTLPVWQGIINRMDNLTPAALGAATAEECAAAMTEAQSAMQLANDNGTEFLSHRDNTENPHQVTCQQIGAAPDGYGLGDKVSALYNWNTAYYNGFIYGNSNSPDGEIWWGLNCKYQNILGAQIAFRNVDGQLIEARRYFRNNDGVWEYVNPPMLEGVEYRTTRRYEGKPVYTKLVSLGAAAGSENVVAVADDVETVVDASFSVTDGGVTYFQNKEYVWFTEVFEGVCTCNFGCENVGENATARLLACYTKKS